MRDFFRVNYLEYEDNYDTNLEQVFRKELLDLNNLFMKNGDKSSFYDQIKYLHRFKTNKNDQYDAEKKQAALAYY